MEDVGISVNYWVIPEIRDATIIVDNKLRIRRTTKIQKLINIVCYEYGVPTSALLGHSRKSPMPEVRNMISYFAIRILNVGLDATGISKWLYANGRGNHSNVFNGAKRISFLLETNDQSVKEHYTNILHDVRLRFPHLFINN